MSSEKKHRGYSEDKVIRELSAKRVTISGHPTKVIDVAKAQGLGNKSWGKIGFLQNYCGYTVIGKREYSFAEEAEKKPIIIKEQIYTNQRRIIC